jgi:uncharacterized protein (TIGR02588 family)
MAEEKSKKQASKKSENENRHEKPPVWEWIIAGLGLILVAGAIGFMLYEAITHESSPPNFSISVDSINPNNDGYLVRFRVKNTGDQTAADVTIEGELKQGAEIVETSAVKLTYVPSASEREGGFVFSKNPNEYELKLRAKSYEKP